MRRVILALCVAALIATARCTADVNKINSTDIHEEPVAEETDNATVDIHVSGDTTYVERHEGGYLLNTHIIWPEQRVCTVFDAGNGGGVDCTSFNNTNVDETYSDYAPDGYGNSTDG